MGLLVGSPNREGVSVGIRTISGESDLILLLGGVAVLVVSLPSEGATGAVVPPYNGILPPAGSSVG